jgi:hypothetical protein
LQIKSTSWRIIFIFIFTPRRLSSSDAGLRRFGQYNLFLVLDVFLVWHYSLYMVATNNNTGREKMTQFDETVKADTFFGTVTVSHSAASIDGITGIEAPSGYTATVVSGGDFNGWNAFDAGSRKGAMSALMMIIGERYGYDMDV